MNTWVRHFDLMVSTRLSLQPGVIELLDTLDDLRLPRAIATAIATSSAPISSSHSHSKSILNPLRPLPPGQPHILRHTQMCTPAKS